METIRVNMTPCEEVQTIHASQNDNEAREWGFELHNNGEKIDSSSISDQLVFKAYEGGTEEILPTNGSTPTTSPFKGDILYPQGLLSDQEFLYRESPTEEDGLAKITDIKGNTLVWNQLVRNGNFVDTSYWNGSGTKTVSNNELTYTKPARWNSLSNSQLINLVSGHKYLAMFEAYCENDIMTIFWSTGTGQQTTIYTIQPGTTWAKHSLIISSTQTTSSGRVPSFDNNSAVETIFHLRNYIFVDLTKMGLDYITDPSDFTSLFPLPYYAYNQGTLLPFKGTAIKTVGVNLIGSVEQGTIDPWSVEGSATPAPSNTRVRTTFIYLEKGEYTITSQNGFDTVIDIYRSNAYNTYDIDVSFPNWQTTPKTFTMPYDGYAIILFRRSDNTNIAPSDITGEWMYNNNTESVTDFPTLNYFPTGMKSAGNVYDELLPNKAITRVGMVDLGSLTWTLQNTTTGNWRFNSSIIDDLVLPSSAQVVSNLTCSRYVSVSPNAIWTGTKGIAIDNSMKRLFVCDSAYSTADAFATAMSGVYLYYELATPTVTSFTTASLVTENEEIPLSNEDGVLIGKCTEQLSSESGFFDAKIKLADEDGECYSNKLQLHVERSPQ